MKELIGNRIREAREKVIPKLNQGKLGILALGYDESERKKKILENNNLDQII